MVAVSAFNPALSAGFVMGRRDLHRGTAAVHAWSGLWTIWFSPAEMDDGRSTTGQLLYTTFWLEHKLWGIWTPFGYTPCKCAPVHGQRPAALAYLLRYVSAVPGAWAVAAVFAVHPMHVESVAWVMGRKDHALRPFLHGLRPVLGPVYWAVLVVSQDEPPDSSRIARPGLYLAALGLFVAAMLSKSVAVTLAGRVCDPAVVEERASNVVGRFPNRAPFLSGCPWLSPWLTCPTTTIRAGISVLLRAIGARC